MRIKLTSEDKDPYPSFKSILGLSALVFFISDVQGGIGPFLSIYLQSELQWDAAQIGMALATINIATILSQVPSGYLVDILKSKRLLLAISCLLILMGCLLINKFKTLLPIIFAQSLIGLSGAIIPPCITAITIGMVKRPRFPKRTSINEFFNHFGNLSAALATGILAHILGHHWILYVVMICAAASVVSLLLINPNEIDYNAARELPEINESTFKPAPLEVLLKNRSLLIFCASVILFHFSNAAQLPLIGEVLAKNNPEDDSLFMAGSIILAQLIMAIVAYSLGFLMKSYGRKPIFIIAFLILTFRALLYTITIDPYLFLSIQLLDGIGAGIFGVIAVVTISDIAKGTGRFNFSIGLIALCTSVGAGLSNFLGGFIAKQYGFNVSFITLALIALLGLIFYVLLMPETKNHEA